MVGRKPQIKELDRLLDSEEAEFLALYGRRRVGKTYLIREHFKSQLCFELTGLKDGLLKEQLGNFHNELETRSRKRRDCPSSWQEAFQQLAEHLKTLRGKGKRVIFLDELPWLVPVRAHVFCRLLIIFGTGFSAKILASFWLFAGRRFRG